jgi:hypothetical protein
MQLQILTTKRKTNRRRTRTRTRTKRRRKKKALLGCTGAYWGVLGPVASSVSDVVKVKYGPDEYQFV